VWTAVVCPYSGYLCWVRCFEKAEHELPSVVKCCYDQQTTYHHDHQKHHAIRIHHNTSSAEFIHPKLRFITFIRTRKHLQTDMTPALGMSTVPRQGNELQFIVRALMITAQEVM
jgi:hypothetical protein